MLRWMLSLPILAIVLAGPVASQAPKEAPKIKVGLKQGEDLPGPFHPFNVTGPHHDHYHCLVTQTSLDPMVILFVNGLDYTPTLKSLEEALDNRIAKNPAVRLSSFTVFLSVELPDVVKEDNKREKIADELRIKAKDLKSVIFCLDSKQDLENYTLDDNATITVVLVKKYKVESLHTLTKDQLTAAKVDEIIAEVGEKLGATRK